MATNPSNKRVTDEDVLKRLRQETKWLVEKYGYERVAEWTLCSKARLWYFAHAKWAKVAPNHDDIQTISTVYRLRKAENKITQIELSQLHQAIRESRAAVKLVQEVVDSLSKRGHKVVKEKEHAEIPVQRLARPQPDNHHLRGDIQDKWPDIHRC